MNVSELLTKWSFKSDDKPLDKIGEKLEHIQHRLEFLAAAEIVRGIFELTERFSSMGEQLNNAAMSAGITVESLQGLQFAAGQAGVSAEEVQTAMARLSRQLYEARNGSEQANQAFAKLGISSDQVKSFKDSRQALKAIADRLETMKDPIAKNALAMELLGRGGFKMVAFLSEGGKSMEDLSSRAEEMGAVLAGPNVRALQEVEDALSAMWQVFKVAAATITSYFAPSITSFAKAMVQLYAANRKVILQNFKEWAFKITYAFGFVYGVVEAVIKRFMEFAAAHPVLIKVVGDLVLALMGLSLGAGVLQKMLNMAGVALGFMGDGLRLIGKPIALFLGGVGWMLKGIGQLIARLGLLVVETFPAVGEALFNLGVAVSANPFGLAAAGVVAAIAAISLALNALWVLMTGGKFEDTWVAKLWSGAKGAAGWIAEKLGIKMGAAPGLSPEQQRAAAETDESGVPRYLRPTAGAAPGPDGMNFLQQAAGANDDVAQWLRAPPSPAQDPSARMLMPTTQNNTINAPVTVNVPAGTEPNAVVRAVKDSIKEHLDQQAREIRRDRRDALAY